MKATRAVHPYKKYSLFAAISLGLLVVDQISKFLIRSFLTLGESFPSGWLVRFTYVSNTGIAFGLKANQFVLVFVALAVVLALLFVSLRYHLFQPRLVRAGLALMLGGALGNLIDRVRIGYVTDFIDFQVWPVFNIADSGVVIGVGLLCYFFLFRAESATKSGKQKH